MLQMWTLQKNSFYIAAVRKQNLRNLIISELQDKSRQTYGTQVNTAGKVVKKTHFSPSADKKKLQSSESYPRHKQVGVLYKKTLLPELGGEGGPILVMPSDYK